MHEVLARYLDSVEQALARCGNAYVERYTEEIVTPQRANLRIRLRFEKGQLLEINEAVVVVENRLVPLDYRYHFQDQQNRLIFRYDSTPHFPALSSFPHHEHLPEDVVAAGKPDIDRVLQEAMDASG